MESTRLKPHIRWMLKADYPTMLDWEWYTIDPTPEPDIVHFLEQQNSIGMVAACGGELVGYVIYSLFKNRIELVRLVVSPNHRGQGIGLALIEKLKSKLKGRSRAIHAVVRDANMPMISWLCRQGFETRGWSRGHFTGEDGLIVEYRIT